MTTTDHTERNSAMPDYADAPGDLTRPDHQHDNDCYQPWRAYEHGYTDGRWFNGRRRPGAVRAKDHNYDRGLAMGNLDRAELDAEKPSA